jgi:surfactin synthase thioesterase subunit
VSKNKPSVLAYRVPRSQASSRLFCFPYAGGGASLFRAWQQYLPQSIELCPVQLPGRETRAMEPAFSRIEPLVETLSQDLKNYFDLPYVFFGYSMGALIAFDLARRFQETAARTPSFLFLAARRGPRMLGSSSTKTLNDRQFVDELRSLGGVAEAVLQSPEIMEMILPTLRADFSLCEDYRYSPGKLLDCPIRVLGGKEDKKIAHADLAAWSEETSASCSVRLFDGGHFFLHNSHSAIVNYILSELLSHPSPDSHDSAPVGTRAQM